MLDEEQLAPAHQFTTQEETVGLSPPQLGLMMSLPSSFASMAWPIAALLFLAVLKFGQVAAAPEVKDPLLCEHRMVMAHDAATTYLDGSHIIVKWAKTQQSGGISSLLKCGARALDWRPKLLKNGTLIMAHHQIEIKYPMSYAMRELVDWVAMQEPNPANFVMLGINDCIEEGPEKPTDRCTDAVSALLQSFNISLVRDCSTLDGIYLKDVMRRSALPGGGSVLAVNSCWNMDYDKQVACSGFGHSRKDNFEYTCYTNSSTREFPIDRMVSYLDGVLGANQCDINGTMFTAQVLWQETVASVIVGDLHGSSLIGDEFRSDLNAFVATTIEKNEGSRWNKVNIVEVNNVCHGGLALVRALSSLP